MVIRSPKVEEHIEHEILQIGAKCGKWSVLEPGHAINYYDKSTHCEKWQTASIEKFLQELKEEVFDRHLPTKKYLVGRKNLLENVGIIHMDQKPQCDF